MKRAFAAGFIIAILCFSMIVVFAKTGLANAQQSPVITSVSPISSALVQNITIQGSGFGNVQPQLLSLGDGSVDTVWGGSTPSIVVYDERNLLSAGATGNWSGFTNGPPDLIGVVLVSWTDTQIVLGGFGSGLNSQFSWSQVSQGDTLQIQIQTASGVETYDTVAGSSQPNQNPTSSSTSSPVLISSVSPISATLLQTITIKGSGFGSTQPQLLNLGDGSVDTVGGGATPVIRIYDESGSSNWEAGVQDSPNSGADSIGVILTSWSNTEIVLGGFGTALNTNGQGQWNLSPGDPLLIAVLTANGQAAYTTTVVSSQSNQNPAGAPPVISSVSPVSAARLQTITIQGSGFGNTQPQLMNLTDGSVDTIVGGTAPVIRIYDEAGLDSWEAGCTDSQFVPKDMIGIYLTSWSDNEIVLGGFGTELNVNGQEPSNINPGDPLIIDVVTSNGQTAYTTTAVSSQSGQNSTSSPVSTANPPTPTLTVSCQSSATLSNFMVEISGNLTSDGAGLQGLPILLSYSVDGGTTWNELTTVNTDNNGNFLAVWMPSVTGNYLLTAEWAGDTNYIETSTTINFAVLPFGEQSVFSVTSNSTISALAFNSTSGELDFTVNGPEGTTGYCDVYIPTSLISDISDLTASLNGNPITYNVESIGNAWLVSFSYQTGTNNVALGMNAADSFAVNGNQLAQWIPYGVIIVLIAVIAVLLVARKTKKL